MLSSPRLLTTTLMFALALCPVETGHATPVAQTAPTQPDAGEPGPSKPDGAALFTLHCAICHIAAGAGQDFGPNLSDAGLRLTRDAIRQSILEPSQTIADGYAQVEVTRKNGQVVVGILAPESAGMVLVKQLAGVVQRIPKDDVQSKKTLPVSAMLAVQKLAPAEIEAVVDYALTLKQPVERKAPPPVFVPEGAGAPRWLLLVAGVFAAVCIGYLLRTRRLPANG